MIERQNSAFLELSDKQFKQYFSATLDSIEKKTGVKAKNVYEITHLHQYYIDSSKTIIQGQKISDSTYKVIHQTDCYGFSGYWSDRTKSLHMDSTYFTNDTHVFLYGNRKKILGLRVGKRDFYIDQINSCNMQTKTIHAKINKNPYNKK